MFVLCTSCSSINANIDLIVEGTELLSSLGVTPAKAADHAQLDSLSHLQEVFMWSFSRGGAAERPFNDAQLFATVVDTASNLNKAEVIRKFRIKYVCMCVCICVRACVCVTLHVMLCICVTLCVCVYVCMIDCMHAYVSAYSESYVCKFVCTYSCDCEQIRIINYY